MKRWTVPAALALLALPMTLAAQDPAPIEIVSIQTSPAMIQSGEKITFSIQIRNGSSRRTRPGTAYIDVFQGDRPLAATHLWGATQEVNRLDAGATTVLNFVTRSEMRSAIRARTWTVPATDTDVYSVRAGVYVPPGETVAMKAVRFVRKCAYTRPAPIAASPGVSLVDLKRLKRPLD